MENPTSTTPNETVKTFTDVIKFPAVQKPNGEIIFDPRFKSMPYTALTEFASFIGGRIVETQWVAEFKFDRLACHKRDCYREPSGEHGYCEAHQSAVGRRNGEVHPK